MEKKLIFKRVCSQRTNDTTTGEMVKSIIDAGLSGARGRGWDTRVKQLSVKQDVEGWVFLYEVVFSTENKEERALAQWGDIYANLEKAGVHQRFNKFPWSFSGDVPAKVPGVEVRSGGVVQGGGVIQEGQEGESKILGVQTVTNPQVITIEEMRDTFPHDLLGENSDDAIAAHPAFCRIFKRNAVIRSALTAVKSFLFTNGGRSSHFCLDGPAGCGKTQILHAIVKLFGEGCCLRLDSTATTKAGIERLYFKELEEIPPFCVVEEIEKGDEGGLTPWLGCLDDRKEIRKVNNRMQECRKVNFLAMCTSNNRAKFDSLLEGALSSRFKNKWRCDRPDLETMRLILQRDVREHGGKLEWIEPALALSQVLDTDDPRLVLAMLDGGDRLLDFSYQADILAIHGKSEFLPKLKAIGLRNAA